MSKHLNQRNNAACSEDAVVLACLCDNSTNSIELQLFSFFNISIISNRVTLLKPGALTVKITSMVMKAPLMYMGDIS